MKQIRLFSFLSALAMTAGMFQMADAQYMEDAQRLSLPGLGAGAKALGMGDAFIGVANDYSALLWNPAGLAQATMGEFSFGLSYLGNRDNSTFFGNKASYDDNTTNLNTLGVVLPLTTRRGSASIAFGYTRQSTFTSGVTFNGYNTLSSIIQSSGWAPDGTAYPAEVSLAEDLALAYADTTTGLFNSPIKNNVQQKGTVTESGGLNNWMIGGAVDVSPKLSVGVTFTLVTGSYRYDRSYVESDPYEVHVYPYDLKELSIDDFIDDDVTGANLKFGLMYREEGKYRIGFTVKTPTWYNIKETWGTTAQSTFRSADSQGNSVYGPYDDNGSTEYDVTSPWVFGFGGSVNLRNLLISGDAEYTDWTQTKFDNASSDVMSLNKDFNTTFRGTFNLRGGLEYTVPESGIRIRGGFIYNPSIYKNDPTSYDQKYITGGLGLPVGESTMIDVAYAHGWWMTYRVNYDETSRVDENMRTNTVVLTLTHRF